MSKERELLNRCAVTLNFREICPLLLKEISELLAQPEQPTGSYFICCDNLETKLSEHFKVPHSIYVYVKQLENKIDKLKKQNGSVDPMSEDVIWDNMPENPMECLAFIRGVKFAEKEHGIRGVE